jgi:hypothetical protein
MRPVSPQPRKVARPLEDDVSSFREPGSENLGSGLVDIVAAKQHEDRDRPDIGQTIEALVLLASPSWSRDASPDSPDDRAAP